MPVFFKRGFIHTGHIPKAELTSLTPKPSFVLEGEHKLIVLHDSDVSDIDPRLVLVVPITSAAGEKKRAAAAGRNVLPSYIQLLKAEYEFLDHDSYVSTAQICPINREWLGPYVDIIKEPKMAEIDIQVIQNIGLMGTVMNIAQRIYERQLAQQAAAGSEFTTGILPSDEGTA